MALFTSSEKTSSFMLKHTAQGRNRLRNRIKALLAQYLPLLLRVRQSGAAVEPNDVILTNLMTSHCFNPVSKPISSLIPQKHETELQKFLNGLFFFDHCVTLLL